MPSIKDLKKRIVSTKSTQQTTKAMKMVSAAKLRRAQEAIWAQRPYALGIRKLMANLSREIPDGFEHPAFRDTRSVTRPNVLLVLVTSDRGLCGGFNSYAIKNLQRWILANGANCTSIQVAFIGKRGHDFFKSNPTIRKFSFAEFGGKVRFQQAQAIASSFLTEFTSGRVDQVKIIYNEFKNAMSQTVVIEDFLPLAPEASSAKPAAVEAPSFGNTLIKPNLETVLTRLLEKNFAIQLFRILLESQASEHGARMSAMENATKNAGEMIGRLTLSYNKQRQAAITKELLEIISGSESQKQA